MMKFNPFSKIKMQYFAETIKTWRNQINRVNKGGLFYIKQFRCLLEAMIL